MDKLELSLLCDLVSNTLGAMCCTTADRPESIEPLTPLFKNIPVFGFVEPKSLDEDATLSFMPSLRVA